MAPFLTVANSHVYTGSKDVKETIHSRLSSFQGQNSEICVFCLYVCGMFRSSPHFLITVDDDDNDDDNYDDFV